MNLKISLSSIDRLARRGAWIGIVLCLVTSMVTAKQPDTVHVTREWDFKGCHFTMSDPYKGRIDIGSYIATINPKATRPFETWIQFFCENKSASAAFLDMGMKRSDRGWVIATERYQPMPEEHASIYQLNNPKWTGAALTSDQTFGDPQDRVRRLGFCITNQRQVLCGTSEQVMYVADPRGSTIPQVIKLLESIEFIDSSPSRPSEAPSTASSAQ